MYIYNSKLWIMDLDEILSSLPELSEFEGKSIMITGASGLICSSIVDVLIHYNETHEGKIQIFVAGRSYEKMMIRFSPYFTKDYICFLKYDATSTNNNLNFHCDYIIHGASNACPGMIIKKPVETMMGNIIGIEYLLNFSQRYNVKRVLYISSSEVYGNSISNMFYSENDYGYINFFNSRNSYSIGKRAAETLCVSYADEYGVESVIVRPGHVYGPTASPSDNRVSSMWAYAAARREDIVMKSDGTQLRSYCYCLDCASAILKVLLKGEKTHAYNISNPNSIVSIKDIAEILSRIAGVKVIKEKPMDDEKRGFNPMNNSVLNSTRLQNLNWKGMYDVERGIAHTVSILREIFEDYK